jgi:hopanoid biosynthesis associated radical SAM protein HpnH
MAVPLSQMWTVASHVIRQRLQGNKYSPLVLMLEPLVRCNLACPGCGKTQYPTHILKRQLSVEECIHAVEECGAPIVSIPGGEPLLHPEMPQIVEALVARKKYVYLCTNGLLLKNKLSEFTPTKYFSFSVHLDGSGEDHDDSVCLEGAYGKAIEGIKAAVARGFRVTTNTTVFEGANPEKLRKFFDEVMSLGVEGMMVSPGYNYSQAARQDLFLQRESSREFFRKLLFRPHRVWKFNQSPLFLEFLAGTRHFECTPWGTPTYNIFGWQMPCYLVQEGYVQTFLELIEKTPWENYGFPSGNPQCANCMLHSGYEPTAVNYTFHSWRGFLLTARATLLGPKILPPKQKL